MTIQATGAGFAVDASAAKDTAKLRDGAREFEAMMLGEMLKPLQFGGAPGDDGENGGGANDTMRGFGTEALCKSIAQGGGFGIANQIVRQVTAEREAQGVQSGGTKV